MEAMTLDQETFAMMRILELIQASHASEMPVPERRLLCAIYFMGRKDERDAAKSVDHL